MLSVKRKQNEGVLHKGCGAPFLSVNSKDETKGKIRGQRKHEHSRGIG